MSVIRPLAPREEYAEETAMTTQAPPGAPGIARARPLTDGEMTAARAVAVLAAALGLLGFVNSFRAVARAAQASFGELAPTVPLGIDLAIAVFSAMDIVLARLDMRPRWVRLVPWSLTAVTIYLNAAGQPAWFGRIAHAVFPALWVVAVSLAAHVIRVRAQLTAGTAIDRIRASRWLLAPLRTALLWRRMVLWEIRSYPGALTRERARLLALTGLQDTYGMLAWRWRAPRRVRTLYRLGELAPQAGPEVTPETGPAMTTETASGSPAPATEAAPEATPGTPLHSVPGVTRKRPPATPGKQPGPATPERLQEHYADDLAAGQVPSIRQIKREWPVGYDRAAELHDHLTAVIETAS